jgi:hypothetical protein
VIDLNPYPDRVRDIVKANRKVHASFYRKDSSDFELLEWGTKEKRGMVYPQRNKVIDDLINFIFDGKLKFLRAKAYFEEYIAHWETLYRADVADSMGITHGSWESSTGMDHYVHATVYFYAALAKMYTGRGFVLRGSTASTLAIIERALGPVPVSSAVAGGTMKPKSDIIATSIKAANRSKNGSGAASGSM